MSHLIMLDLNLPQLDCLTVLRHVVEETFVADAGGNGKVIAKLREREQLVLMLYYEQDLTMREVGELMGVGESRVPQIHTLSR